MQSQKPYLQQNFVTTYRKFVLQKISIYNSIPDISLLTPLKPSRPKRLSLVEFNNTTAIPTRIAASKSTSKRTSKSRRYEPSQEPERTKEKEQTQKITQEKLQFLQAKRNPKFIVSFFTKNYQLHHRHSVLDALLQTFSQYIRLAVDKDSELAAHQLIVLLNRAVDWQDLQLLLCTTELLADHFMGLNQFEEAIYFYNQVRLISTYICNSNKKIDSLISLSRCASKLHCDKDSFSLLLKAAEYAYISRDRERQLLIYDLLGMRFFYAGQMIQAKYYHERFTQAICESSGIKSRSFTSSIENYVNYKQTIPVFFKDLQSLLLAYLGLPLLRPSELPCQRGRKREECRYLGLSECRASIKFVMQDDQFKSVIELPKQPERQVIMTKKQRNAPALNLIIRQHQFRLERKIHKRKVSLGYNNQPISYTEEDWLGKIYQIIAARLRNSESLRGRAILSHDNYSNMLMKRRGSEYFFGFIFKGMLISYLELVTGRIKLFRRYIQSVSQA